jgi:hypothetical protein
VVKICCHTNHHRRQRHVEYTTFGDPFQVAGRGIGV